MGLDNVLYCRKYHQRKWQGRNSNWKYPHHYGKAGIVIGNTLITPSGGGPYDVTIIENTVTNNLNGIELLVISGELACVITRNTIANSTDDGILVRDGRGGTALITIIENNIQSHGQYAIHNEKDSNITATNNWWGTANISEIEELIYDYYDNLDIGEVFFEPFAQAPFSISELPPAAAFTATPVSGTVPLTVSFGDQAIGSPTSWLWDFGDGGSSTEQNPTYTYNSIGTYTVTLTASSSFGSDTQINIDYIQVDAPGPPEEVIQFLGLTDDLTDPLKVGDQITLTADVIPTGNDLIYYKFFYRAGYGTAEYSSNPWVVMKDFSTDSSCTYAFQSAGKYIVVVWAATDPNDIPDDVSIAGMKLTVQTQTESGTGDLRCFVLDAVTGQGIGNATVAVTPGNYKAVTEPSSPFGTTGGKYEIKDIPVGTYTVTATKEGHVTNSQINVVILGGTTTTIGISLTPE